MENIKLRTKFKILLFKICLFDSLLSSCDFGLYDTHHFMKDVTIESHIMHCVAFNDIDEDTLKLIDCMYLNEKDMYKRLKIRALLAYLPANILLKSIVKDGFSLKKLDDECGLNIFKYRYDYRQFAFEYLCRNHFEQAFKTRKHYDNPNDPMYDGCFLVGVLTPMGYVTYHFKMDCFDKFKVVEIEHGPKYDSYNIQEGLYRLASLTNEELVKEHLEKVKLKSTVRRD